MQIKAGWGYEEVRSGDFPRFRRTREGLELDRIAWEETSKPGHVIVYAKSGLRIHVEKRAIDGYDAARQVFLDQYVGACPV